MEILLTGASGFLGQNLLAMLAGDHNNIYAISRRLQPLDYHCQHSSIRWAKPTDIDHIFHENSIDCVIHTATQYGRNNLLNSEILTTNTLWPLSILEAAYNTHVPLFINTGSSLPDDLNPYSLSKAQFRDWGKYLAEQSDMRFFHIRLEHMYGPDDDESKFTSHLINSCKRNTSSIPLTYGKAERDFIYIDDVVSAYKILLEKNNEFAAGFYEFELGSGQTISIREFAELVKSLADSSTELQFGAIPYRKNEVMYSIANTSVLNKMGWKCMTDIETGIKKTLGN